MDLTLQGLQTNGKFFSNFGIIFQISYNFLNNSGVGSIGGEGICANSTHSSFKTNWAPLNQAPLI